MIPAYCATHGWHDGPCEPGKRRLTRADIAERIEQIDGWLGDDEGAQSLGWRKMAELRAERVLLVEVPL